MKPLHTGWLSRAKLGGSHNVGLPHRLPQRVWASIAPHDRIQTILLAVLATFVVGVILIQARAILIPMTIAWLLSLLLSPLMIVSRRHGLPNGAAATAIVVAMLFALGAIATSISVPSQQWFEELPSRIATVQRKLTEVKGPISDFRQLGERIGNLASIGEEQEAISVKVDSPSWLQSILTDDIPAVLTGLLIVIVLTYFLLLSQGKLLRQFSALSESWGQRRRLITTTKRIRSHLSAYLLTITVINTCLALIVALALYLADMPSPLFWGILAGLLNFAPYIGPLCMIALLTLGAISEFNLLSEILAIPLTYILITGIEGQLITPLVVGKRLSLSPTAVFISVIIWTWVWGAAGALLAAPILACVKILCENLRTTDGIKQFSVSGP